MKHINNPSFLEKIVAVRPHERQINWQSMEFYGFIHYGINQFTNREWGTGSEDVKIFNPKKLDTDQWCQTLVKAGMKGVILTAKHHDGFCLWDTATTSHSVMNSPYKQDIVAQLATSCKKYNLKLGLYLSPWDRHAKTYGEGRAYDDFFCNQLAELLTGYGELFCLWFDGACGEGPSGKVQYYDWNRYYELIRKYQPNAVISVCGPDVRWCGNEAGHCRTNEWSVVPHELTNKEKIQEASQQSDSTEFREKITSSDEDLGSREFLANHEKFVWYPAEVNTSIRPGWFYHEDEDLKVKSLEELTNIYLQSVGGNATFLLNIPPHPDGFITEFDVKRLTELGQWIQDNFTTNLLADLKNVQQEFADDVYITTVEALNPIVPKYLVLQENIKNGQKIEGFRLSYLADDEWIMACNGEVIGHKAIKKIETAQAASMWKLEIFAYRSVPEILKFELY